MPVTSRAPLGKGAKRRFYRGASVLKVTETKLPFVLLSETRRFGDERGFFAECWNRKTFLDLGIDIDFVQDNLTVSAAVGTVRWLHFQALPHAQDKLVRGGRGRFVDVAVDARKGSPTYGKWITCDLSFENGLQLLV